MYNNEVRKTQAERIMGIYGVSAPVAESIVKSEDNDISKGGEGSKGGKVIGHTKSGKPIYEDHSHKSHSKFTHQEHHEAYLMHDKHVSDGDMGQIDARDYHNSRAKKKAKEETDNTIGWTESGKRIRSDRDVNHEGYSDFTKKDHVDAAEAHFKEMSESGGNHKKHENSFNKYASHKDKSDEIKKSEELSIIDTLAAGNDIVKAEAPNFDQKQQTQDSKDTAPESSEDKDVDDESGKPEAKKKEDKKEVRKSIVSNGTADFIKGQQAKILACYGTPDIEKGGEGSKGGKVIGHTKSGKPIYDSFGHEGHKGFKKEDHNDAAKKHAELTADIAKKEDENDTVSADGKKVMDEHWNEGSKHSKEGKTHFTAHWLTARHGEGWQNKE